MVVKRSISKRVFGKIIDNLYPLVSFRKHCKTGEIHLFPSKLEGEECIVYKESFCSRRKKSPVKKGDTESLSKQRLKFRGKRFSDSFECKEKEEARVIAALLQNNGFDVCGVCVSHLYSR